MSVVLPFPECETTGLIQHVSDWLLSLNNVHLSFLRVFLGFPGKEPACQCRRHKRRSSSPWVGKTPWRRAWQCPLVLLLGEALGQRSFSPRSTVHRVTNNQTQQKQLSTHAQVFLWFNSSFIFST